MIINEIDQFIIKLLNGLIRSDDIFIKIAYYISNNDLFKGIFIVTLLWYVWLKDSDKSPSDNIFIFRTGLGAVLAIIIGRLAQNYLPMRLRPIHDPEINYVASYEFLKNVLGDWSSFPSDHALLFFALSTAIWSKHHILGMICFAWSLIVISFLRIYLGLHYPSDILAGIILGIGIMLVSLKVRLPAGVCTFLNWMRNRHAGWLYAGVFFLSIQMATLFHSLRQLGRGVKAFLVLVGLAA